MTSEEVRDLLIAYMRDANAENATGTHRGFVLVWASIIDDVLLRMLKAYFVPLNSGQRDELYGPMGPLGGFSNRTKTLHALGIIHRDEMAAIDELRSIRNKFAHKLNVSLDDEDLADRCRDFGNLLTGEKGRGDPKLQLGGGCSSLLMLLVNRLSRIQTTPGLADGRDLPDRAYGVPEPA